MICLYSDTLFRYGGYGFWRANNFLPILTIRQKNGNITQPRIYNAHEAYDGNAFFVGRSPSMFLGDKGQQIYMVWQVKKSNQIWTFDFQSKEWTNGGKTAINFAPYKSSTKRQLVLSHLATPRTRIRNLLVDLNNNQAKRFYTHP